MNGMRKSCALIIALIGAASLVVLTGEAEEQIPAFAREMLAAHNKVRQKVGVPPLKWSNKLAMHADEWAETLAATGAAKMQGIPGQNIGYTTPPGGARAGDIVAAWAAEVANYDDDRNVCIDPKLRCHHYTQVVWRNTNYLGCAAAQDAQRDIWVCDYDPPGNDVDERPY